MVKGLEVFGKYFSDFKDQYVIIGGAACDIHIQPAELTRRLEIPVNESTVNRNALSILYQKILSTQFQRTSNIK